MTSIFTICTSVPNDFSKNHILTFRELPRWNLRKLQPHTTLSLMAVISQSEEKEKELFCNFFMKFYRPHTVPFDLFSSRADYGKERTKSSRLTRSRPPPPQQIELGEPANNSGGKLLVALIHFKLMHFD